VYLLQNRKFSEDRKNAISWQIIEPYHRRKTREKIGMTLLHFIVFEA